MRVEAHSVENGMEGGGENWSNDSEGEDNEGGRFCVPK